jgi:tetratricopeptide (TPR) repeat protein
VEVPQETPLRGEAGSRRQPPALVPVLEEDFRRARLRILFKWLGMALLVVIAGAWVYWRSSVSLTTRDALNDGERMLKTGRYSEAIQSLNRVVAADSKVTDAYLYRARANAALSQTEAALRDFTKLIQLQPANSGAYLERAVVRLRMEDYKGVIADSGEAIQWDPQLSYAYELRGMAYRALGSVPRSLEDFNRAVELAPGVGTYFQRASAYQSVGEHRLAIADLDQVILRLPGSPVGYLARTRSREALGDMTRARSDRETGRRLEDRNPRH